MKNTLLGFFCLAALTIFGQHNILLRGKVELISNSKNIVITTHSNAFRIPINTDSTFHYELNIEKIGGALVRTDSSGETSLWLEAGEYSINFKEIKIGKMKTPALRVPFIKANQNAELRTYFNEESYKITGSKQVHKDFYVRFLDSVIAINPSSTILPEILRLKQTYLGDSLTTVYLNKIVTNKKDESIGRVEKQLKRNDKIKKEIYFEPTKMKKENGNNFSFSSLSNKKIILIDFWASWCGPCRSNHVVLNKLYENYKVKGFEIVGISLDKDKNLWKKAIIKEEIAWINISELKGYESEIAKNYFINEIPFNIVIDGNKKIIATDVNKYELEQLLKKL
jgi:thiol-disulfide isomerase/thioredoxin